MYLQKTGECTAQVHMNNAEKTSNVSQDCKIVPGKQLSGAAFIKYIEKKKKKKQHAGTFRKF